MKLLTYFSKSAPAVTFYLLPMTYFPLMDIFVYSIFIGILVASIPNYNINFKKSDWFFLGIISNSHE